MNDTLPQLPSPDLIIFDMDGVLVDTRSSYDQAVLTTVNAYCEQEFGRCHDTSVVDLAALRGCGGFNNDWDLTYGVVWVLESGYTTPERFLDACSRVGAAGGGLVGLQRALPTLVTIRYDGDVGSGNLLKQLFQERYLGPQLFHQIYGLPVGPSVTEALIDTEVALISKETLVALSMRCPLAIATGRPRAEAEYTLKRLKIQSMFSAVVTLDDCPPGRGKPDPYPLELAMRRVASFGTKWSIDVVIYLGDLPDDVQAARAASTAITVVGIGDVAGADLNLSDPDMILELLPM